MALVPCKECKKEISSAARICPSCGAKQRMHPLWWVLIVPVVLFAVVMVIGASVPEYMAEARAARKLCEQMAAGVSYKQYECDQAYSRAVSAGEAALDKRAKGQ